MADRDDQGSSSVRLRIRREAGGLWGKAKGLLAGGLGWFRQTRFHAWHQARGATRDFEPSQGLSRACAHS